MGRMHSQQPIVEETITSDEYVSLLLISILNMYIWNFNIYVPIHIILKEKFTNCKPEKIMQVKRTNAPFFVVILQVKTLIAIVYRPQEKDMQIILNALWIFIIIHNFIWQHFRLQHKVRMQHLKHINLFGVSTNRMLILQLKLFLSVKFIFSLWFFMWSCFYFLFWCCRCSYNTNVYYFHCHNSSDRRQWMQFL